MRIVIFSDVHGNLPAFEIMLKHAGECDSYICLGDLVNYGPWSNECVDLAISLPSCTYIMGNHEQAFLDGYYPGDNPLVKTFFKVCQEDFTRLDEIRSFKESFSDLGYNFQHTVGNRYIYPDTTIELDANYVIGHSHHQFLYRNGRFRLYNAGSVGQNRKYINVINYLVLDTERVDFEMIALKYDVSIFINELRSRKYPSECIDYYATKELA